MSCTLPALPTSLGSSVLTMGTNSIPLVLLGPGSSITTVAEQITATKLRAIETIGSASALGAEIETVGESVAGSKRLIRKGFVEFVSR